MKWLFLSFFILNLLSVSKILTEDAEDKNDPIAEDKSDPITEEEDKAVKEFIEPEKKDESVSDKIFNYNRLVADTQEKMENKQDTVFKNLLHGGDGNELKSMSEGDMVLDAKDIEVEKGSINPDARKRGMVSYARKLWFTKVIPYEFRHPGTVNANRAQVELEVMKSFDEISSVSCLKFRPRQASDNNWIRFVKRSGCYSGIGRKYWAKQSTDISLGDYCVNQPIITHEIFHALGFFHEQSRTDRDSYIDLHWNHINPSMKANFDRHPSYDIDLQNTPYDYNGILHYGNKAFTIDGGATITAKGDENRPMGGYRLTKWDIRELNKMYHCEITDNSVVWSPWSSWTGCYVLWNKGCSRTHQRKCFAFPDKEKCKGGDEFGVIDEHEKCKEESCKTEILKPEWGSWSPYNKCSRNCGEGQFTRYRKCDNPPPKSSSQHCSGLRDQTSLCMLKRCAPKYYNYDVDFESGFIPWRKDNRAVLTWQITSGQTPNRESGPSGPYLTQNYAYLAAKSFLDNFKTGRVISDTVTDPKLPKCVSFYYQLNGKSIVYLDFYIRTEGGDFKTFWTKDGHQGSTWEKGAFTIPSQDEKYEIIFEGKTGRFPDSDIAVDDIRVDNRPCVKGTEGCRDYYSRCKGWKRIGECHKNFKWMLKTCCASCSGMANCRNRYDNIKKVSKCKVWAKRGECRKNRRWMWHFCCESCRDCVDYSGGCSFWALNGWCEKSNWMKTNCKSSCNICKV